MYHLLYSVGRGIGSPLLLLSNNATPLDSLPQAVVVIVAAVLVFYVPTLVISC